MVSRFFQVSFCCQLMFILRVGLIQSVSLMSWHESVPLLCPWGYHGVWELSSASAAPALDYHVLFQLSLLHFSIAFFFNQNWQCLSDSSVRNVVFSLNVFRLPSDRFEELLGKHDFRKKAKGCEVFGSLVAIGVLGRFDS